MIFRFSLIVLLLLVPYFLGLRRMPVEIAL